MTNLELRLGEAVDAQILTQEEAAAIKQLVEFHIGSEMPQDVQGAFNLLMENIPVEDNA